MIHDFEAEKMKYMKCSNKSEPFELEFVTSDFLFLFSGFVGFDAPTRKSLGLRMIWLLLLLWDGSCCWGGSHWRNGVSAGTQGFKIRDWEGFSGGIFVIFILQCLGQWDPLITNLIQRSRGSRFSPLIRFWPIFIFINYSICMLYCVLANC